MLIDKFVNRHIGPRDHEIEMMLKKIGASSLDELINQVVPSGIRMKAALKLSEGISERKYYRNILELAS